MQDAGHRTQDAVKTQKTVIACHSACRVLRAAC